MVGNPYLMALRQSSPSSVQNRCQVKAMRITPRVDDVEGG